MNINKSKIILIDNNYYQKLDMTKEKLLVELNNLIKQLDFSKKNNLTPQIIKKLETEISLFRELYSFPDYVVDAINEKTKFVVTEVKPTTEIPIHIPEPVKKSFFEKIKSLF